jgi:hypothetical protein
MVGAAFDDGVVDMALFFKIVAKAVSNFFFVNQCKFRVVGHQFRPSIRFVSGACSTGTIMANVEPIGLRGCLTFPGTTISIS